ncbi:MAG: DNA-directed RNA polymerase subunit omega [Bacillota bacterium]|nr:DNA-directed RNA polymerase subunit omega [Bacillota bacterium]
MINPSIDELLEKVESRYMLVTIIAKRAREIVAGDDIMVDTEDKKPINIAIQEFNEGRLVYSKK